MLVMAGLAKYVTKYLVAFSISQSYCAIKAQSHFIFPCRPNADKITEIYFLVATVLDKKTILTS